MELQMICTFHIIPPLTYCHVHRLILSLHFNGNLPGGPGLAGTRMSPFWILLGAKGDGGGGGDKWSYKMCKAPVTLSPPTNQHPTFFTGQMPFLSPNQQCQSTLSILTAIFQVNEPGLASVY